ncbi:hypothetical protein QLX08_010585 [Tetragonisca angustula]|uniref:Uncharacterized protein n=1 Tax=Tetragonisca angustula TaxID=166442 RepID=A0AAW0ZDM4_9HYME
MLLGSRLLEVNVTIVRNPSMTVERATITLKNERFPDITDLFVDVETICDEQPFRIYCRISERCYVPVFNFISFKGGLELICNPEIYVVVDEPLLRGSSTNRDFPGKSNDSNGISKASDDVEFKSEFTEVSLSCLLTDVQILQCALSVLRDCDDDPAAAFRYLFVGTPPLYGRELKDTDRQMKILIKGLPRPKAKPSHEPFPEVKNIRSQTTSKASKKRRK